MLKSITKVKLVRNTYQILLIMFNYNTEQFNITYAVFKLRFSEKLVNLDAIIFNLYWIGSSEILIFR